MNVLSATEGFASKWSMVDRVVCVVLHHNEQNKISARQHVETYICIWYSTQRKIPSTTPTCTLAFNSTLTLSSKDFIIENTVNRMPIVAGTEFLGKDPGFNPFRKNRLTLIYY